MSTINNRKTCDKGKFSSISDDDDIDSKFFLNLKIISLL